MTLDSLYRASRAKRVVLDPFHYEASFNPLPGVIGGAALFTINIQNDSDFVLLKSMLCSYTAVGTFLPNPDYLVTLFDTGSGRALQDLPVHVRNIMGSAELPYLWPEPKMINGASQLQVTLINNTNVAARVEITFAGFKVFYKAGFNREAIETF